jgi:FKBP-type peptidyl-prolyl cis-trans isomerase
MQFRRHTSALLMIAAMCLSVAVSAQQQKPASKADPTAAPSDVAKPPADAVKTTSGLATKVLQKGTGDKKPGPKDMVTVHYTGWTTDGKVFDSSYVRGKPNTFGVGQVIKGWGEGVQLMVVGEKRRLWIPEPLAYEGKRDPKGMLVFDLELLEIAPSPTVAPPDVASPPPDAKKTASGLAYKVLRPGRASARPMSRSRVTVHYTGWTTDGKMFDSSVARGRPETFGLDEVIAGWTEGVQLMTEGERTRFWIPERLAYEGKAGAPRGMLVFDIELLSHKNP